MVNTFFTTPPADTTGQKNNAPGNTMGAFNNKAIKLTPSASITRIRLKGLKRYAAYSQPELLNRKFLELTVPSSTPAIMDQS
jgi:hypothetical protein